MEASRAAATDPVTGRPIILATSAPANRPQYRRDFLTCLAAPNGQAALFSYRPWWIQQKLLDAGSEALRGRRAILVFREEANNSRQEAEFVAFRYATLQGFAQPKLVDDQLYDDHTYLGVEFTLDGFVPVVPRDLPDLLKTWADDLAGPSTRTTDRGTQVSQFMFEGPELRGSEQIDDAVSWTALVSHLSGYTSLEDSFFFRVAGVRSGDRAAALGTMKGRLAYQLTAGSTCRISLDAFSKAAEPLADAIETATSSPGLIVDDPVAREVGGGGQVEVSVSLPPLQASRDATLVIRGRAELSDRAPRIQLPIRIGADRRAIFASASLIVAGVVLSGFQFSVADGLQIAIRLVGAGLVVGGVFLASQRAPGITFPGG